MDNKWQITIDVDQVDVDLLCIALEHLGTQEFALTRRPELDALQAQIKLAWIEREVKAQSSVRGSQRTEEV